MAGKPPSDHIEVEWQFDAPDTRRVADWLERAAVPGYTITPGPTTELRDTYLDTDDWRLHRARFTCRIRQKGEGAELTLKSMADARDGIRSRREMNEQLEANDITAAVHAPGPCGETLRLIAGRHPVRPLFTLAQTRRTFILADSLGPLGELAVDDTVIADGGEHPSRLARVEVEVSPDAIERSRRFVDLLTVTTGLEPAGTSKFEAAVAATGAEPFSADRALGPSSVAPQMTAGEVAFAVMRRHFGAFLANEGGTRLGEDIEALHDMRVAARRLRAAMSAFRPFLSPRMQRFRDELGWVGAALGAVRDLDVQLERMAEWRGILGEQRGHSLDAVEALLAAQRQKARRRMLAVLDSRRYDRLVQRFSAALLRGPARSFGPGRQAILAVAPDLLERRYRRVRRGGAAIGPGAPPEAYHLLRIEAKKLRYALEFVGAIYERPAIEFSAKVTALQDLLGLHQDAYVAVQTLHDLATGSGRRLGPETLLAMGAIAERYERHAEELRKEFPATFRPLKGGEWARLRKLVEARRLASRAASPRRSRPSQPIPA